jgi:3-oxoacyl-[acyl-carrier protein] reductase
MANRVALVTGAARGIGAAVAIRLAEEGNDVAVLDLDVDACADTVEAVKALGRNSLAVGADVSDEASVTEAVAKVAEGLGAPLVLVNNAGVLRDNLLFKMELSDWQTVMAVHLGGAFLMSRATQRFMTEAGWGRIINMSSTSALGNRGQANYSAAKAGLQGFTKTLAIELGRYGVTVNSIAPGFIVTAMTKATADRMHVEFDDFEKAVVSRIPVGRAGQPEDIANAAAFFADERSSFVSGQVLYVAGGPVN